MAKKPKVSKTPAASKTPKASPAAPPIPWKPSERQSVPCFQKDPSGKSVHDELYAAVKSRAEAIWRQTGGTHGHQEADWRQAREELGVPAEVVV